MGGYNNNDCEDMGGVIFPLEELLLSLHFRTVGPGAIALIKCTLLYFYCKKYKE